MDTKNSKAIKIVVAVLILLIVGIILFFVLKEKTYIVTFNSNGGTFITDVKVKRNDKVTKPKDPIKDGYIFDDWYYENEKFDFNTKITKDITLEAKWLQSGRVSGVHLNLTELSISPNEAYTLKATVMPEDAINKNLKWVSSDKSIVSVDSKGKIKALKEGNATITVTTEDGNYEATCKVTVTNKIIHVNEVVISGNSEVNVGKTIKLSVKVLPDDASNKDVTWSSSNEKIATVDNNGNVKGIKAGKVTITVKSVDGSKSAKKEITVKATSSETPSKPTNIPVTDVKITGNTKVNVGSSIELKAVITPSNATNKNVTWESSDNKIAKVDSNGKVTGVSDGDVTITVTTKDGNKKASITITVSSVYRVELVRHFNDYQLLQGYYIRVYKNNSLFKDYDKVVYKNSDGELEKDDYLMAREYEEGKNTITILLKNGQKITVTFKIVN